LLFKYPLLKRRLNAIRDNIIEEEGSKLSEEKIEEKAKTVIISQGLLTVEADEDEDYDEIRK
jgi:hypothetical protein